MAAKKRSSDDVQGDSELSGGSFEGSEDQDLYQTEVSRYSETIDRGLEEAFQRYGFTLFHSLPPIRQVELAEKAGLMKHDSVDQYNLGGVAAERGDFEGAIKYFQKALELDGTFADAAFNLAVAYERLDRKSDAINAWSRFLELSQVDEDRQQVEAHLAELRA